MLHSMTAWLPACRAALPDYAQAGSGQEVSLEAHQAVSQEASVLQVQLAA